MRRSSGRSKAHEPLDLVLVEAGAHVAGVGELAAAHDGEDERAERAGPAALPPGVPGDDELLLVVGLDLQPVARAPARLVAGRGFLGDDPLELLRLGCLVERLAVVEGLGEPDRLHPAVQELRQPPSPLVQRQVEHRLPVDFEDVEHVVDERPRALLHDAEARPAVLVESADLAVEHAVRRADGALERPRDVGEALGEVVPAPALQRRVSPADVGERAIAVPLDLVEPARAGGNVVGQRGEHRRVLDALPARGGAIVLLPEQEPVLLVTVEPCRNECPQAREPLAGKPHRQAAVGLLLDKLVRAPVPDLHGAGAVGAGRDLALEGRVVERVVLDVDGQVPLSRLERNALGDGPARERAVPLEAEVVVEPARVMALDDEDRLALAPTPAERLGGRALAPLALVVSKARHTRSMPRFRRARDGYDDAGRDLPTGGCRQRRGRLSRPLLVRRQQSQADGDNPVDAVDC